LKAATIRRTIEARDRRRRDLIAVFIEELDGSGAGDVWTLVNVRKAAELTALVEQDRAAMLRGANIDRDEHIKLGLLDGDLADLPPGRGQTH
jgi:hypothetical protein